MKRSFNLSLYVTDENETNKKAKYSYFTPIYISNTDYYIII